MIMMVRTMWVGGFLSCTKTTVLEMDRCMTDVIDGGFRIPKRDSGSG